MPVKDLTDVSHETYPTRNSTDVSRETTIMKKPKLFRVKQLRLKIFILGQIWFHVKHNLRTNLF